MAVSTETSKIQVNQIVGKDGSPAPATLTSNLWVGHRGVFSRPTEGNLIKPLTTGEAYFDCLITECDKATMEVCILGWQVNWDALLAPGVRLYDLLLRTAKRGVRIYVMPWDDTNPVQTYDDQTKIVLESINRHPDVNAKGRVHVLLAKSMATVNNSYFSHHQKQVIIDRKIAFIGGIDLAYGRFDDASYDLHADKAGRQALNRYNGCVVAMKTLDVKRDHLVDPDQMSGVLDRYDRSAMSGKSSAEKMAEKVVAGGWQVPYAEPGKWNVGVNSTVGHVSSMESNSPELLTLDPATQPRMPWQDIHSRIEGPVVSHLLRNFVNRWNASGGPRLAPAPTPGTYAQPGKAHIQVLRSAPAAMAKAEYKALNSQGGVNEPNGTEDDIHRAMVQLIEKASHFIYIENQFFVSSFGQIGGDTGELSPAAQYINAYGGGDQNNTAKLMGAADDHGHIKFGRKGLKPTVTIDDADLHKPPTNKVCEALIKRITRAILDAHRPNFHVYITLPVHPEGSLNKASIAVQVYWTMQTIAFGSKSLLNGIRRAIKVRELMDKDDAQHICRDHSEILDDEANREYESVPVEACFKYVTLLNLRNWAKLGEGKSARYVTEQVYVHSKLMIVDDLYALFGSANINDRSLLGERDSEIAVLVMDGETSRADVNGKGSQRPVRKFAHELRMEVWKKLFGIAGGVRPATDLKSAIDAPGSPDSWKRIQAQAEENAAAYEAAFDFVPRNWSGRLQRDHTPEAASILPTWNPLADAPPKAEWKKGNLMSPMPFQPEFWSSSRHSPAGVGQLDKIKGFFTALPIHWTKGENIKFAYPTALVAGNEQKDSGAEGANEQVTRAGRIDSAPGPEVTQREV